MRGKNAFKSSAFRNRKNVDFGIECKPPTYHFSWAIKRWSQRAKLYTEIPCWDDGKKEKKSKNNGNIACIVNNSRLCQPRSENYKYPVKLTSYISFIVNFEKKKKKTWLSGLHFIHIIDGVDLLQWREKKKKFIFSLHSSEPLSLEKRGQRLMTNLTMFVLF